MITQLKDIGITVDRLARMRTLEARAELSRILGEVKELSGSEFAEAPDFNARLVTACRERGVVFRRQRRDP